MSSSDVAVKSMDLARSVSDILNQGGAVSGLIGQVFNWLARERINEAEFAYCLSMTRALIYPNEKGLEIQSSLRKSEEKLRRNPFVAGLNLVSAGRIGRWMAQSPEYCYLATTVASLLVHHDMKFAADAICEMVLFDTEDKGAHRGAQVYAFQKSQVHSVALKIVESITLNVVNCGHDLGPLPAQLSDFCRHTCDSSSFARVAMTVARSTECLMIRCQKFVADVFGWLLAHIECRLELSIAGQIVYQVNTGNSTRYLLFMVEELCACNQHQKSSRHNNVSSIFVSAYGQFDDILTLDFSLGNVCGKRPSIRQRLYDVHSSAGCGFGLLSSTEKCKTLSASQSIVLWILEQPTVALDPRFATSPNPPNSTVGELLSRWPRICNESFDDQKPRPSAGHSPSSLSDNHREILYQFSETRAVLETCKSRCSCSGCHQHSHSVRHSSGCLRSMATSEILRTIAHAIADGFGADNVSGISEASAIEAATSLILTDLLDGRVVPWEHWFSLAAMVHLGCTALPASRFNSPSEVIGVQFGSLVVIAPWIDLRNEAKISGWFGFKTTQAQLRGVESDFAVLYAERTSVTSRLLELNLSEIKLPLHDHTDPDTADLSLQLTIHQLDEITFQLSTLVKTGSHVRIINPSDVFKALTRSCRPQCSHNPRTLPASALSSSHRVWAFEEATGLWDTTNRGDDLHPSWEYYTTILDTHAKVNILLALSPHGCVVKDECCCIECAYISMNTERNFPSSSRRVLCVAGKQQRYVRQL